MKYQIKNLTGDLNNVDPELHEGRKLYATSQHLQQLLPIAPQTTHFVSEKAMVELTTNFPKYVQVLDVDGSVDLDVIYRKKVTLSATWQAIDLGRFAGRLVITNTSTTNTITFSLSAGLGLIADGGTPPAATISDVLKNESLTINTVMAPVKYIYLKGSGDAEVVYILVD